MQLALQKLLVRRRVQLGEGQRTVRPSPFVTAQQPSAEEPPKRARHRKHVQ
jgi:hypothetical protein